MHLEPSILFYMPLICWRGIDYTVTHVPDSLDCFLMVFLTCCSVPHISSKLGINCKWLIRWRPRFLAGISHGWCCVYFLLHHTRRRIMSDCPAITDGSLITGLSWWQPAVCFGKPCTWTSSSPSTFHVTVSASTEDACLKHLFHWKLQNDDFLIASFLPHLSVGILLWRRAFAHQKGWSTIPIEKAGITLRSFLFN